MTGALDEIRGTVERITFHNEENGYTIARLMPEGGRRVVTILGSFPNPTVGEFIRCQGVWTTHERYGAQMQVQSYEPIRPATAEGIRRYLGSGMVKGIGPVMARRIVDVFGVGSLDIIDREPDRLHEVPGIGDKRVALIQAAWDEQREVRNVMVFLQGHGVTPAYAAKIYANYRGDAIRILEQNPYQLAADIWGIGFKTADKIARHIGFALDDPRRIQAGVLYIVSEGVETGGNVYLTRDDIVASANPVLGDVDVDSALDALVEKGALKAEEATLYGVAERAFYTPELYDVEQHLAARIRAMAARPVPTGMSDVQRGRWIDELVARQGVKLSAEQTRAVDLCLASRVCVLTGGPGTGKTTTMKALVAAMQALQKRVLLASPTGRAAKRLSEAAGAPASTIHRLLLYDPATRCFQHHEENPLQCDALIVDEASMLDVALACALVRALSPDAQLVMVGDVDQLPSVGPGNVLGDLIGSGIAPVARLTQVFRQASLSTIIANAHAVNQGRMPELPSPREPDRDFVFVGADDAGEAARKLVAVVLLSLPRRGYRVEDIQALTPMQKGHLGAMNLNAALQQALNPPAPGKPEVARAARLFRLGDRVIQMRNNYEKGVFNGEIGTIVDIDGEAGRVVVRTAVQDVLYDFADLDELALAYCLTIHKSQGSEFPVAVIAMHTQHYALLQRNLLYTAITRAKRFAVVVGNKQGVALAVRNDRQAVRRTRLRERLQGLLEV